MRIALLGARGQLGTDLRPILPGPVLALDWPELDITSADQVRTALRGFGPDVVINCAAQTNVDQCEDEPEAAFRVNALGAMHVAQAAAQLEARVVYISTDYVFGLAGVRRRPYTEDDPPGPLNMYGTTKLAGEYLTRAASPRALIVRTCGLFGHAGARGKGGNFVETMRRLGRQGRPVRVVDDQRVSPTSTVALAAKLLELIERGVSGLFHVTAVDSCTWYEFARAIFEEEGLDVELQPIPTSAYPLRAVRPALSALASTRLELAGLAPCVSWREMLHAYLCPHVESVITAGGYGDVSGPT